MIADSDPVTPEEATAAFALLEPFEHLLLAVSGGPDSLALLFLLAEWRRRRGAAPGLSVATVDHGLRETSAAEAAFVAGLAAGLGLPHATLVWADAKPSTAIAERARAARYDLLQAHALSCSDGRVAVVTGHHSDDQAETLLMRLARGSGVEGLAAMRSLRPLQPHSRVMLARPLLAFPKVRIAATIIARGIDPVRDPANEDASYERVRIRAVLKRLEEAGVTGRGIARSAGRLDSAREALIYAQAAFERTLSLSYGYEVFAALDRAAFAAGPRYLRQKVLGRLIERFGGASAMPRLSQIEALDAAVAAGGKVAATCGGATVSAGTSRIRVWRESGRLSETLRLAPGEARPFDARYVVRCRPDAPSGIEVRALGADGMARLSTLMRARGNPPSRAAMGQPAFWRDGQLIAAPTLEPFAKRDFWRWAPPAYQVVPLKGAQN